jgi:hypothetical protein
MREQRTIKRQELFDLVWSKPTSRAARELGISDVGLSNICKKLGVPKPERGYWVKVASGQQPAKGALYQGDYPSEHKFLSGPLKSAG